MMYMANPTKGTLEPMLEGKLGYINTPAQGNRMPEGVWWCADNSCFGTTYPGDEKWFAWLGKLAPRQDMCFFATAPDIVGDAAGTLERSRPWLEKIRDLGYKAALVGQDGLENLTVPWDEFDAFFVGGSTEWKLSQAASGLATEARDRGKHTHLGRVNSRKRVMFAKAAIPATDSHPGGYDTVDGTYLVFGPDINLPKLLRWMNEVNNELALI
jgi:hypothetical protein